MFTDTTIPMVLEMVITCKLHIYQFRKYTFHLTQWSYINTRMPSVRCDSVYGTMVANSRRRVVKSWKFVFITLIHSFYTVHVAIGRSRTSNFTVRRRSQFVLCSISNANAGWIGRSERKLLAAAVINFPWYDVSVRTILTASRINISAPWMLQRLLLSTFAHVDVNSFVAFQWILKHTLHLNEKETRILFVKFAGYFCEWEYIYFIGSVDIWNDIFIF